MGQVVCIQIDHRGKCVTVELFREMRFNISLHGCTAVVWDASTWRLSDRKVRLSVIQFFKLSKEENVCSGEAIATVDGMFQLQRSADPSVEIKAVKTE